VAACRAAPEKSVPGYVEAEYIYVSSPIAGHLEALSVKRGDIVGADAPLYELDKDYETAARAEGVARINEARAQLADLEKGLRPTEIEAIEARLVQAKAAFDLSVSELKRREKIIAHDAVSRESLEQAQSAVRRNDAHVQEVEAELRTAKLGAREDRINSTVSSIAALEARLAQLDWNLAQKTQTAPVAGMVYDTFYNPGEWIPAGKAVLALLQPERIKIRFYVGTESRTKMEINQRITVKPGAGHPPLDARIAYIAPQAEYTPPVIYSREMRSKLVFMVEAVFDAAGYELLPGQPVDVEIGPS